MGAAAFLAAGLAIAEGRNADEGVRALAEGSGRQGRPLVRIGLDASHAIRVTSEGGFRVVDPVTGRDVWKREYDGPLAFVAEGGPVRAPASIYRVQVGAFSTPEAAETERAKLEAAYGVAGIVAYVPDRASWRVRLGGATDRDSLAPLVDRLRAAGVSGAWIIDEPAEPRSGVELRLVDASYDSRVATTNRVAVLPSPGRFLEVEGKPYRGIVEVRITRAGTVRPVNWVEIESYLLGVVPAELGPEIWPQIEALKAQAVAARTYVWKNLGQFGDEGYDLCATPRCQAYGGVSAEHPLSDRAVAATRGEILTFEGAPISALYSATCGGHTEDGFEIFPEEKASYLRGVPCRAEGEALAALRIPIPGRVLVPRSAETGDDVTRDWALLSSAGVIEASLDAGAAIGAAEIRSWTRSLALLVGRPAPKGALPNAATLGAAAAMLVDDTGWSERARVLLGAPDVEAILRDPEARALPEDERRAVAYLAWIGALPSFPDGSFGAARPPSRARVAAILARVGDVYDAFRLREGAVSSASAGRLRIAQGKGSLDLPLSETPFLFSSSGGRPAPVPILEIWAGDRIRFRTGEDGRIDFLELRPPVKGVSDDRSAKVYSWEVRQSRAQVEEAVNRRVDIGRLRDLQVVRRGVSGRIVELRLVGARGSSVVRGFDVRTVLGLRDSLAVIEPQRDASGEIDSVVFTGKGWGHGVGLCQVGAYGMALRGVAYSDILAHYYRGAVIDRLPSATR